MIQHILVIVVKKRQLKKILLWYDNLKKQSLLKKVRLENWLVKFWKQHTHYLSFSTTNKINFHHKYGHCSHHFFEAKFTFCCFRKQCGQHNTSTGKSICPLLWRRRAYLYWAFWIQCAQTVFPIIGLSSFHPQRAMPWYFSPSLWLYILCWALNP